MMPCPAPAAPQVSAASQVAPRDAAFAAYRDQVLGAVCSSQAVLDGIRDVLAGNGTLDDFALHIMALETHYRDLGNAAQGLAVVGGSSGVA